MVESLGKQKNHNNKKARGEPTTKENLSSTAFGSTLVFVLLVVAVVVVAVVFTFSMVQIRKATTKVLGGRGKSWASTCIRGPTGQSIPYSS